MLLFNWPNTVTWPHFISRERELVSPLNLGGEPWILMNITDVYPMDLEMMVVMQGGSEIFGIWEMGAQE